MKCNVGTKDRYSRIGAGAILGLISLGILTSFIEVNQLLSPVLGVLAAALLATGYTGKCKMYELLGLDTS